MMTAQSRAPLAARPSAPGHAGRSPARSVAAPAPATHRAPVAPGPLPIQPASIPSQPQAALVGPASSSQEAEADRAASRVTGLPAPARSGSAQQDSLSSASPSAPPSASAAVEGVVASPGRSLDAETRAYMEPRFGRDLSHVRIHTDAEAGRSAQAVAANAYAYGNHAVFAPGRYNPRSGEGRRLLAHELAHTLQQSGPMPVLQRDPADKPPVPAPAPAQAPPAAGKATVQFSPDELQSAPVKPAPAQPAVPADAAAPGPTPASAAGSAAAPAQKPVLFPPPVAAPGPLAPVSPLAPAPAPAAGQPSGAAPAAPSRLSLHDFGTLSLGLRLGFPEVKEDDRPGVPPSAFKESPQRGEILNYMLNGQVPSMYQLDTGKLVGAVWGIFSEKIAPDVARKIAAGVSSKPTGKGMKVELDATLILSTSGGKSGSPGGGGGLSATLTF